MLMSFQANYALKETESQLCRQVEGTIRKESDLTELKFIQKNS